MSELIRLPGDDFIRPRFQVHCPLSTEEATLRLKEGLKRMDSPVRGRVIPDFASLMLPEPEREMWSPYLTVSLEQGPGGRGTLVRGVYGPAPGLWTMFMFFYTALALSATAILIYGLVLRALGEESSILWLVPILLALIVTLWLAASLGQRLSRHQMTTLHQFVEQSLGMRID
jgi:hypothetical protein